MDILFVWNATISPLYEWRIKCIRRAMEVYPDASFKVITQLKEFFGMEIISLVEVLRFLREYKIDLDNPLMFADYARYYWLSIYPNTLYIDTDAFCISPIPTLKGIGHDDYWAIWNGNDLEGVKEILERHEDKQVLLHTPKLLASRGTNLSCYFDHKPAWRRYVQL